MLRREEECPTDGVVEDWSGAVVVEMATGVVGTWTEGEVQEKVASEEDGWVVAELQTIWTDGQILLR